MILPDNSVIFTGLPSIRAAMDLSTAGLSWVQDAYTLVFGGLLLLGARLGDLLGRVLECVGTVETIGTALDVVRDDGVVGRVGAAQYTDVPMRFDTLMRNRESIKVLVRP